METGHHVLIDIDSLLDTRLALIGIFDDATAISVMRNPDYYTRYHDTFSDLIDHPDWSDAEYADAWRVRNEVVLSNALPTMMSVTIRAMVEQFAKEVMEHPELESVSVDINMAPYIDVSRDTQAKIRDAVKSWLPEMVTVRTVLLPEHVLTPMYIRAKYNHVIMYSFAQWLETHFNRELTEQQLKDMYMPRVSIMFPKLYASQAKYDAALEFSQSADNMQIFKDPFQDMVFMFNDIINLGPLSVSDFSAFAPANNPEVTA